MHRQHLIYGIAAFALIAIVIATDATPSSFFATTGSAGFDGDTKSLQLRAVDNYAADMAYAEESMIAPYAPTSLGSTAAEVDQRVIRTASLEFEVDVTSDTANAISEIAKAKGGFVESSSIEEAYDGSKRGWITIRVPVSAFDIAITEAKALANSVARESTNAQDVTEQYTDLEARLHAAEAQEQQYLIVLTQAKSVGDVLAVQEHLADVRAEIESMQGQLNYLENRTAYSSITFTLVEESRVLIPAEKYELLDEVKDATRALILAAQQILTAIIWAIVVGGPFALLAYAGYRGFRAWQRRR